MTLLQTITACAAGFIACLTAEPNAPLLDRNAEAHKGTSHRWSGPHAKAAAIAQSYVGTPYHWGGSTPQGFDCSGLVQYSFSKAGVAVPRTADSQHAAASPVLHKELRQGDLVFFRRGQRLHVGIYVSDGRFIHAPSPGKRVMYSNINARYWQTHYSGAGRIRAN